MISREMKKYVALNDLAEQNGTVIIGGSEDTAIPLCELKQAFDLDANLYNRSADNLSVDDAVDYYAGCVAPIHPGRVLLHIGAADVEAFRADAAAFDQKYRQLIQCIRAHDENCAIAIVSLRNPQADADVDEMNRHLKFLAESERCEFGDISARRLWNPNQTKDILSFVYSLGFVRPLPERRSVYDLVKILFCYDDACAV